MCERGRIKKNWEKRGGEVREDSAVEDMGKKERDLERDKER